MNGCEAASEISRLFPKVPILLLTMYLSQPLLEVARRVGIRGAVSKTDILQVVSGVEALLRNKDFFCFAN
jgi:DNA-binding NarL/FixJ family response regulator